MAYVGEGSLTNDPLKTFGGYGVVQVPKLQKLLTYICENGLEHHVAMNLSKTRARRQRGARQVSRMADVLSRAGELERGLNADKRG